MKKGLCITLIIIALMLTWWIWLPLMAILSVVAWIFAPIIIVALIVVVVVLLGKKKK